MKGEEILEELEDPFKARLTSHAVKRFCEREKEWFPLPDEYRNFRWKGNFSEMVMIGGEEVKTLRESLNYEFDSMEFYGTKDPRDYGALTADKLSKSFILEEDGHTIKAVTYKDKEGFLVDSIEVKWV